MKAMLGCKMKQAQKCPSSQSSSAVAEQQQQQHACSHTLTLWVACPSALLRLLCQHAVTAGGVIALAGAHRHPASPAPPCACGPAAAPQTCPSAPAPAAAAAKEQPHSQQQGGCLTRGLMGRDARRGSVMFCNSTFWQYQAPYNLPCWCGNFMPRMTSG